MSYAMNEYGRMLSADERKQKALENAVSWWGQWQWYELRRPVLYALINGERYLDEYRNSYTGAKVILNFLLDMDDAEIEAYCKARVDWLLDDRALDTDDMMGSFSVWKNGTPISAGE